MAKLNIFFISFPKGNISFCPQEMVFFAKIKHFYRERGTDFIGKCVLIVKDHILRQLPQSLFAKLAAGTPGRPAKLVCSPARCRTPWQASQVQTRQGINNQPKPASKGAKGTGTWLWKMYLDTKPLLNLLELRKNTCTGLGECGVCAMA